MSSNLVSYKITDKNVDVYNEYKHKLPCINCIVRAIGCFSEKQATKSAKYLRYTVELKTPCREANLEMNQIINLARDLVIPLPEMDTRRSSAGNREAVDEELRAGRRLAG